jgi:hypothetical protein
MKGNLPMRRVAYIAAMAGLAASLAGCSTFRKAAGMDQTSPDEFAVVTKAPLIIPPDYNLKPPKPGATPTNQIGPTDAAEAALYGRRQPVTSTHGQLSAGEQELLAKAGATNSNNMIRQKLAADNHAMQAADKSFTNQILFGMISPNMNGTPVDANAAEQKLGGAKAQAGQNPQPPATQDKGETIQDAIGGWLDGIF